MTPPAAHWRHCRFVPSPNLIHYRNVKTRFTTPYLPFPLHRVITLFNDIFESLCIINKLVHGRQTFQERADVRRGSHTDGVTFRGTTRFKMEPKCKWPALCFVSPHGRLFECQWHAHNCRVAPSTNDNCINERHTAKL